MVVLDLVLHPHPTEKTPMTRTITKIADLGHRPAEAGRIRLGRKTKAKSGKDKPTSIDTLRFTSPYRDCIEMIAEQYGGTAKPWDEPTARIRNQWEVVTETADVDVLLPADPLDQGYELWASGGRQRRCDGETCEVVRKIGDQDYDTVPVPCICLEQKVRECSPKSRLLVVIPTVPLRGVWRVETSSWTALEELPYQVEMLETVQASGRLVQARLSLHKETKRTPVGTRHYVVPRISMNSSPLELMEGRGGLAELASTYVAAVDAPRRAALTAGGDAAPDPSESAAPPTTDDDIVDAEIVEDDPRDLALANLRRDAEQFALDPDRFVSAVVKQCDGDVDRMRTAHSKMIAGVLEPTGFDDDGRVAWQSSRP